MTFGDPKLPDRFWDKVITVPFTGCWLFLGELDKWGYGRIWWQGRKCMAHRVAFAQLYNRRIRRTIDHKCVMANCVNPHHLQEVTQRKNNMLALKRRHRDKYGLV